MRTVPSDRSDVSGMSFIGACAGEDALALCWPRLSSTRASPAENYVFKAGTLNAWPGTQQPLLHPFIFARRCFISMVISVLSCC